MNTNDIKFAILTFCFALFAFPAISNAGIVISALNNIGDPNPEPWEIGDLGFAEDALTFVDRTHEYNSAGGGPSLASLPFFGADYVRTTNDGRSILEATIAYEVTFAVNADVYLFLDTRKNSGNPLGWMTALGFVDSGLGNVGIDESGDGNIDQESKILFATLAAGTYNFQGIDHNGNNYGIAAIASVPEPTSISMVALGLLSMGYYRWRKKQRTNNLPNW